MDSFAVARAESRIADLEYQIRSLKIVAESLRCDIQRLEQAERTRLRPLDNIFAPMMIGVAASALGLCIAFILVAAIKKLAGAE